MLVQELCDQSLESLVFGTKDKQCGSFSNALRRGETHEFFFNMCSSICEGLCYMHSIGYLHRDLKLSNVLVINGVGKLSDLGFARAEAVITGTAVGTLSHMAPELLEEKVYSFSSDVYSLGILTWELWYGTRSYSDADFAGYGVAQFIDAEKRGERPKFDKEHTMMDELINLVEQCRGHDPKQRPTVQQVGTILRSIDEKYRRDISR
ncbi:dual serine/threonine and tyrosine protein kinase-like [Ruditapes philippinarum]|uniref:dual serine/threonine and tyrosine protein kinase-like n=1 Tax=Ruditapes philippinarum TaxID=129788 RepID=UPI00295B19E0|nr:dual serine/threonine and tyrosine protein kinase-like [Ruditapes philippinarum]